MNLRDLQQIVGALETREANGYRPGILIQGMTQEQFLEILLLAQIQLSSYEKSVCQPLNHDNAGA